MDFALVHVAHSRIQQRLNCLSLFLRAKPDLAEHLRNSFSWDENEMVCIGLFKRYHSHSTCEFFRYALACFCICFLLRFFSRVRLISWLREGKSDQKFSNANKINWFIRRLAHRWRILSAYPPSRKANRSESSKCARNKFTFTCK